MRRGTRRGPTAAARRSPRCASIDACSGAALDAEGRADGRKLDRVVQSRLRGGWQSRRPLRRDDVKSAEAARPAPRTTGSGSRDGRGALDEVAQATHHRRPPRLGRGAARPVDVHDEHRAQLVLARCRPASRPGTRSPGWQERGRSSSGPAPHARGGRPRPGASLRPGDGRSSALVQPPGHVALPSARRVSSTAPSASPHGTRRPGAARWRGGGRRPSGWCRPALPARQPPPRVRPVPTERSSLGSARR